MKRTKILLVDDDKIVLRTIEKLLAREGYELTVVESGQKAVEISKDIFFDLIIVDIRMPGMNGIEMIERIKKLQESKVLKSKFMIITGYSDADSANKASQMNIYQFLFKPFDKDLFLEAIGVCLRTKEEIESRIFEEESTIDNQTLIDNFIKEQEKKNKSFLLNKTLPVMGWYSTYVPEEIIIAAGFLPYRIMGIPIPISFSKTYLSGNLCSNIQSILECALNGEYSFLDGMIIGASADAAKRLYDIWLRHVNISFCHLFDIPKLIDDIALTHYMQSIYALVEEIERYFKIKISNSSIEEAILICNKTRQLLKYLNELRKVDVPPITSQQFLAVCKLAMVGNKKDFNHSLEVLLSQIRPQEEERQGLRILLTGSFQDQPWFLNIIEEKGGIVVCEDLCTRLRYFSGLVDEDTNPIEAIAKRYINTKPASANLISLDQRADYLLKLIEEFNIDGVIYYILKFDDPYLFEFPHMKNILSSYNIPVLRIETEHNTSAIGQIMTRIQAFMETLKLMRLRK